MEKPKYRRVLLKISGEALAGDKHFGLDFGVIGQVTDVIKECVEAGVQMGIVIGGGNFWRGVKNGEGYIERTRADHMGMLATAMNCMAVADVLEQKGVDVRIQTALEIKEVAEPYIRARAIRHLEKGRVVIFGCGIGSPFFSTDTAAVLRAADINADVILLAKNIDGVYNADPAKVADAVKMRRHLLRGRAGPAPRGDGLHGDLAFDGQSHSRARVRAQGPQEHPARRDGRIGTIVGE